MFEETEWGGVGYKGEPEQAHLAGPKELSAERGGKGLGSVIMEIIYSGGCFSGPHAPST